MNNSFSFGQITCVQNFRSYLLALCFTNNYFNCNKEPKNAFDSNQAKKHTKIEFSIKFGVFFSHSFYLSDQVDQSKKISGVPLSESKKINSQFRHLS
jgi:hypothetical protein